MTYLDIGVFLYATEILFETAAKFKDLEFIDFGSGFKVPYKEGDVSTDIEDLGDQLSGRFNDFCKSYGKDIALAFEPGKFLVVASWTLPGPGKCDQANDQYGFCRY